MGLGLLDTVSTFVLVVFGGDRLHSTSELAEEDRVFFPYKAGKKPTLSMGLIQEQDIGNIVTCNVCIPLFTPSHLFFCKHATVFSSLAGAFDGSGYGFPLSSGVPQPFIQRVAGDQVAQHFDLRLPDRLSHWQLRPKSEKGFTLRQVLLHRLMLYETAIHFDSSEVDGCSISSIILLKASHLQGQVAGDLSNPRECSRQIHFLRTFVCNEGFLEVLQVYSFQIQTPFYSEKKKTHKTTVSLNLWYKFAVCCEKHRCVKNHHISTRTKLVYGP